MSSLHRMWREPKVNYSTHRRRICSSNPARVSTKWWVSCIQLFQGSYSKCQSREISNMTLETLVSQMDSNDLWPLAGHIKEPRPQLPIKSAIDLALVQSEVDGRLTAQSQQSHRPLLPDATMWWCRDQLTNRPKQRSSLWEQYGKIAPFPVHLKALSCLCKPQSPYCPPTASCVSI